LNIIQKDKLYKTYVLVQLSLCGIVGGVGISNILCVDIQALLTGLKLCWEARYINFMYYHDFFHVVQLTMNDIMCFYHHTNLLEFIWNYLAKDRALFIHISLRDEFLCWYYKIIWQYGNKLLIMKLLCMYHQRKHKW